MNYFFKIGIWLFASGLLNVQEIRSQGVPEIDTLLMRATFKIESAGVTGTAFILEEPMTNTPGGFSYVLVTAGHVFEEMRTNTATLFLRTFDGTNYQKLPWNIQIRSNGVPLYTRHPHADVAAMRVFVPVLTNLDLPILSTTLLMDDRKLKELKMQPGDEVRVLGFPYDYESNEAGFPILRSGRIASFPVFPSETSRTFLVDIQTFKGTSGGPVYVHFDRRFQPGSIETVTITAVVGVVSGEIGRQEVNQGIEETSVRQLKLGLGVVVHAQFIREVVAHLPPFNP